MRVITWRGRLNPVQTHPGEISNSTDSRLILAVVTRVPGSQVWELEATGSGGFCEELQRLGRRMRQGLGLLSREPRSARFGSVAKARSWWSGDAPRRSGHDGGRAAHRVTDDSDA